MFNKRNRKSVIKIINSADTTDLCAYEFDAVWKHVKRNKDGKVVVSTILYCKYVPALFRKEKEKEKNRKRFHEMKMKCLKSNSFANYGFANEIHSSICIGLETTDEKEFEQKVGER